MVVPDFLLPPIATTRYEPLTFHGFVDDATLSPDDFDLVQQSIDRYFYAVVPQRLGEHFTRLASPQAAEPQYSPASAHY